MKISPIQCEEQNGGERSLIFGRDSNSLGPKNRIGTSSPSPSLFLSASRGQGLIDGQTATPTDSSGSLRAESAS